MATKSPILIIDDNYPVLKILSKSLQSMGYDVDKANDGDSGTKKIDNKNYGLIFTDFLMPGKSGAEVLEHSKKCHNEIPVVGMSGTPWLLEGVGFDAVLSKPFSIVELFKLTKQLLPSTSSS